MALVRYTPRSTFVPWPELDLFSNRLSRVFGNAWDEPDLAGNWIPAVNPPTSCCLPQNCRECVKRMSTSISRTIS